MGKLIKAFIILVITIALTNSFCISQEASQDNETFYITKEMILEAQKSIPLRGKKYIMNDEETMINLAPKQFKAIRTMEDRIWHKKFDNEKPLARVEQLELYLLGKEPQNNPNNITQRIEELKLASQRYALAGTSIPPSISRKYKQRYLQNEDRRSYDDNVGLLDGLLRATKPELYKQYKDFQDAAEKARPAYYYME